VELLSLRRIIITISKIKFGELFFMNKMKIKREYYPEGQVESEGYIKNGKKEGEWICYYDSGEISSKVPYLDGKKHGIVVHFHKNGVISGKRYWENDICTDKYEDYYDSGQLKEVGIVTGDDFIPDSFWDKTGNQLMQNGTGKKFEGEEGEDVYEMIYENGELIKETKISDVTYGKFIPFDELTEEDKAILRASGKYPKELDDIE
jgi:hypothetical protein